MAVTTNFAYFNQSLLWCVRVAIIVKFGLAFTGYGSFGVSGSIFGRPGDSKTNRAILLHHLAMMSDCTHI